MAAEEIQFLPDRLNQQPVVFIGLTDGELRTVAMANVGVFGVLGSMAGVVAGGGVLSIGLGGLAAAVGIWMTARVLRRLKRGKPAGYHADAARAWLEDRGLAPKTMLREAAVWDVRARRRRGRHATE